MDLVEATLEGARLRFRPILMTSLAFGFGVLPLAVSHGPGSGSQNAIGTSVLGGMITATILVVIFSPLFYVLIEKISGRNGKTGKLAPAPAPSGVPEAPDSRVHDASSPSDPSKEK